LRYFSTLGYTLEALAINEVGSGLQIVVCPPHLSLLNIHLLPLCDFPFTFPTASLDLIFVLSFSSDKSDKQDNLAGVNVEINAVLIMQTLFGFELGNYYRSVTPLPLQTESLRPHHILLIPPQSLRKRQSRLMNQGCSRPIRIHCRSWDLVGSSRSVFPEREEVISCLIVLCFRHLSLSL
jgi:hypothetical protein